MLIIQIKNLSFLLIFFICANIQASAYNNTADETYRKLDNSLTLQVIPSTYPLQWNKPRDLLFSILKNQYYFPVTQSDLGHLTVELNCSIDGRRERFFIGQAVKDLNGFKQKLIAGYGLSLFNRPGAYRDLPLVTIEGKLNDQETTYQEFDRLISINHFAAISFEVNAESCLSALNFAKEYKQKTHKGILAGNRYGFGADPLKFEGAGCATLAEALLIKANLNQYQKIYLRDVYVSSDLLGDPKSEKKVSVLNLLMSSLNMSQFDPEFRKFSIPDPQKVYDFIIETKDSEKASVHNFPKSQSKLVIIKN